MHKPAQSRTTAAKPPASSPSPRHAHKPLPQTTAATPEDVLFVLYHSALKPVQERLRNHFQKYVLTVQEITPEEWASIEPKPGTPKYAKARDEFISEILNRKPKKPVEEEVPPPPPPVPDPTMGRRGR